MRPLALADLDELMRIEAASYPYPWSRGNFQDSLAHGNWTISLWGPPRESAQETPPESVLLGYAVAMEGVEEVHLLNLTVHPQHRRLGHAQRMLSRLVDWAVSRGLWWLWLEVRASNESARRLYEHCGFEESGLRRGYYPNARSSREDAVLMRLDMRARAAEAAPTESATR